MEICWNTSPDTSLLQIVNAFLAFQFYMEFNKGISSKINLPIIFYYIPELFIFFPEVQKSKRFD